MMCLEVTPSSFASGSGMTASMGFLTLTLRGGLEIPTNDMDDIMGGCGLILTQPLPPPSGYVDFSWIGSKYDNNFTNMFMTQES